MKSSLLFLSFIIATSGAKEPAKANLNNELAFFNYAGSESNIRISGGDLLKKILQSDAISISEINYLNANNYSLEYSGLPNDKTNYYRYGAIDDKIYVEAKPYSYKSNGTTYTWNPSEILIGNQTYPFVLNDESHQLIASGNFTPSSNIKINFEIEFELDKSKVSQLLNAAYLEGEKSFNEQNKYEADIASYNAYLEALNYYNETITKYIEFKNIVDAYNEYLKELEAYQQAYQAYLDYLHDVETFEERVAAYNNYLRELEAYNKNKDANREAYEAYIETVKNANYQLNAMKILWNKYTIDGMERVCRDFIMGETVTSVLNNKDDLVKLAGAPETVINEAYTASNNCRIFLREYEALKTNEEKYKYYFHHYSFIRKNAEHLLRCLDKLYRSGSVASIIDTQGKTIQYTLLISMLSYFANAIDDFPIYNYEGYNKSIDNGSLNRTGAALINDTWKFRNKTYVEWLGASNLMDTTQKGEPINGNYPSTEVVLLEEPEEVEKPEVPVPVAEPIPPTPVTDPATVEYVEKPELPETVNEPIKPEFDELHIGLINAFSNESLTQRETPTDTHIKFIEAVDLDINDKQNVAIFHDEDSLPIYYSFFNVGTSFVGNTPFKPGDGSAIKSYTCLWSNDGINAVNLDSLNESMDLYPFFVANEKYQFLVKFVVGNKTYNTYVLSGEMPVFNEIPSKEDSYKNGRNYYYEFVKWDKEFSPVTQDITYTAIFNELPYLKVNYFVNNQLFIAQEYKNNELLVRPEQTPQINYLNGRPYEFLDWNFEFGTYRVTDDLRIDALFEDYYRITFSINNDETYTWVKKGQLPICNLNPTKDSTYTKYYEFAGWSKSPNGEIIDNFDLAYANQKYYAVFLEKSLVNSNDEDVAIYSSDYISIVANELMDKDIDISLLLERFNKTSAKACLFLFNDVNLSFSTSNMEMLANLGAKTIRLSRSSDENNNHQVVVYVKDADGNFISKDSVQPTITLYHFYDADHYLLSCEGNATNFEIGTDSVSFRLKLNAVYNFLIRYKVQVNYFGNATIKADKQFAFPGETISISYEIVTGYYVSQVYAATSSGAIIEIDESNQFVMPNDDVTIYVLTNKNVYHFRFFIDDVLYCQIAGNYGDYITLPTNISKNSDGIYEYIFTGWDKDITIMTGDLDFHATFDKIPLEFDNGPKSGGKNYSKIIGIAILSVAIVGIAIFFIFLLRKKPKK